MKENQVQEYSLSAVAAELGIDRRIVRADVESGALPAYQLRTSPRAMWRITPENFALYRALVEKRKAAHVRPKAARRRRD